MFNRYVVLAFLVLLALTSSVRADVVLNNGGSCCGTGPFGTVGLLQMGPDDVQVTVTLAANEVFANTGAGSSLSFNVDEAFSFMNVPSGFTTGTSGKASPFGTFADWITCGTSVCGNGTSPPHFSGPLVFDVTNAGGITPADFVATSQSDNQVFAADIGIGCDSPTGCTATGNVAGAGGPPVPEPKSTAFLLCAGLGLAAWKFKKRLPA